MCYVNLSRYFHLTGSSRGTKSSGNGDISSSGSGSGSDTTVVTAASGGGAAAADALDALALGSMLTHVACFNAGLGPIPWIVCPELFPPALKAPGTSAVMLVLSGFWWLTLQYFDAARETVGMAVIFLGFGLANILSASSRVRSRIKRISYDCRFKRLFPWAVRCRYCFHFFLRSRNIGPNARSDLSLTLP